MFEINVDSYFVLLTFKIGKGMTERGVNGSHLRFRRGCSQTAGSGGRLVPEDTGEGGSL